MIEQSSFLHLLVRYTIYVSCWLSVKIAHETHTFMCDWVSMTLLERLLVCLIWLIWCNGDLVLLGLVVNDWIPYVPWYLYLWRLLAMTLVEQAQKQKVGHGGKWKEISESGINLMLFAFISVCSLVSFFNALKDV